MMETDTLSSTFAALADPTRRAILARLAKGEATVNELAAPFEITVQGVSKHLKVLERAGIPYELLTFPNEGHGIYRAGNREELFRRTVEFLLRSFGAD